MLRGLTPALILLLLLPASSPGAARAVPLVDAVREGNVRAIRSLLQQPRIDVNAPEPDGSTALHWAAHRGDLATVDLLLRAGARAVSVNAFGITPLSLAAENGNAAVVARLLKGGAASNTTVKGGETVLMTAARAGRADVVRVLIEAGADVNARETTRGQTALMGAAAQGHADVVRLLAQRGADIHAVSRAPSAKKVGGARVQALTEGRSSRVDTFTPLQFAVRGGQVEAARALLDAGASIAEEATQSMSLLSLAILNLHFDVAAFLIERGADVNFAKSGTPPLHQLVQARTPTIGAFPPPQPPGRGYTSLDIAKLLLARGADVDSRARGGATPFLAAAKGADYQMMRLLAANGADVTAVNSKRTNALALAAGVEMTNPNEDSGTDADSFEALKLAIALGAGDVSAANNDGDTPVHGATFRQTQNNIRLLAEHGAQLDVRNKRGVLAIEDALNGIPGANNSRRTPKPDAAKVLYELMVARGLNPPDPNIDKTRYNFGVKVE